MEKSKTYFIERCLRIEKLPDQMYNELIDFYDIECKSTQSASRQTHGHQLKEWEKPLQRFIVDKMNGYGFTHGKALNDQKQEPRFWYDLYQLLDNIIDSPNLRTLVPKFSASAFERSIALKLDLEFIIENVKC